MINKGTSRVEIGRLPGLLRLGTIVGFDPEILQVDVYIGAHSEFNAIKQDTNNLIKTQLPVGYYGPNMFAGGYPESGTPVIVGQGDGGQWFIVSVLAKDPTAQNTLLPNLPELDSNTYIIQNDDKYVKLTSDNITIGSVENRFELDTKRKSVSYNIRNQYTFTEATRTIDGIIRRDVKPNKHYTSSLRLDDLEYDDTLKVIPLDPKGAQNYSNVSFAIRNPPRTEHRETVYEFARSFNVLSDDLEFNSYHDQKNISIGDAINRREGRADALSLSLIAPNYLMETIKGTVVDIYGNVLDINRSIIPYGQTEKLSIRNIKNNLPEQGQFSNVFDNIKTLERREIAFHFELNSKKSTLAPPDVNGPKSQDNYARQRSRFSLDIDKEGLFKLNVPASSETGNIPLLTRYENFSTVTPNADTQNPNDLALNQDNQDVLLEGFAGGKGTAGVVTIKDELNPKAFPKDRFSSDANPSYIKFGTAYHNIADTCPLFREFHFVEFTETTRLNDIVTKNTMVSPEILISGPQANGGGRSGSLNFDGSLDINIGANTIDRQSVLLDMQGGLIGNIGRDIRNNVSMAIQCDGEVLLQSGGATPSVDTRFNKPGINNGIKSGVVDIRVLSRSGDVSVVRIDENGISIHSLGRIAIYSQMDMMIRSKGKLEIDSERLILNGRMVIRNPGMGTI